MFVGINHQFPCAPPRFAGIARNFFKMLERRTFFGLSAQIACKCQIPLNVLAFVDFLHSCAGKAGDDFASTGFKSGPIVPDREFEVFEIHDQSAI